MKQDFLLNSETGIKLYQECASKLPIIDYHNHLSLAEIACNKRYDNIYDLWIKPDPYKHRAMRMCGIEEKDITGSSSDVEKFCAWCSIFPRLVGNPLYIWSLMELRMVFGITEIPDKHNALLLYEKAGTYLKNNSVSVETVLDSFGVEYACPCTTLNDSFDIFKNNQKLAPSLRGDDIVNPTPDVIAKLEKSADMCIHTISDFKKAITIRLDEFCQAGGCFVDHALDNGFSYCPLNDAGKDIFNHILEGKEIDRNERQILLSYLLCFLGEEYAKRNIVMQLHIGAQRYTSSRLRNLAGAAGGFACVGNSVDIISLTNFLDDLEKTRYGLPKTVLFTLNPADNAMISSLSGSYSKDGVVGLITQGPAWWWCDHKLGIWDMLENTAAFGMMSNFIGMTTDSRSILSFVRHDYFRRVLCSWLGTKADTGELVCPVENLMEIVYLMSYGNAEECIKKRGVK